MARFYGGDARESIEAEFGAMEIQLNDGGGKIFAGTPSIQTVWESHNDEVHVVPPGFFITAHSPSCEVQGMENEEGNRFGLQFHPEVNDSEYGKEMFENFVKVCAETYKIRTSYPLALQVTQSAYYALALMRLTLLGRNQHLRHMLHSL